jgi:hypothetical protein
MNSYINHTIKLAKKSETLLFFTVLALDMLVAIVFLSTTFSSVISNTLIFLTGAVVTWYTYETYLLRKEAQINTAISIKPIVVLDEEECQGFQVGLHNVGQGAALNIEMRIAQFHKSQPGYTNLRKVSLDINNYATLAPLAMKKVMTDSRVMAPYVKAEGDDFKYGVRDRVAFILTYDSVRGDRFCTVVKGNVWNGTHILWKNAITADYSTGNLPTAPTHIIDSSDS